MKAYYITFNTTGLNRRPWPLSSHYSGTRDLFGISIDTIQEGGRWYMVVHPGGKHTQADGGQALKQNSS